MSPRPDVSEERKSQILDAATRVFSRLGLPNARMEDVADEAGLSKGALYWYFKNKDDLIIGIVESLLNREFDELNARSFSPEISAKSQLSELIEVTIVDFNKFLIFKPIFYELIGLAFRHKKIQRLFKHYFRSYMNKLVPLIEKGVEEGEFRQVDPEEAAVVISAIFEGTILLNMYDPETVDVDHHWRSGLNLLLKGLEVE